MSNKSIMKKTNKDSLFITVQTGDKKYNWESLEKDGYHVLQVMPLNERSVIVEYGIFEVEELEE